MGGAELRAAIKGRNVVEFTYRGRTRIAHPRAIFIASTGTYCLDADQIGGRSSSGPLLAWRRFDLNAIEGVTVLSESFDVDPEFAVRVPRCAQS
jgi:hypothetical protein